MEADPSDELIDQATGVLVFVLRTPPLVASAHLTRLSSLYGLSLEKVADAVVSAASGEEVPDPVLRSILWEEWGARLFWRRSGQ
jgi:hypothetical protein